MDTTLPPVHPEAEKGVSPLSPQKKATGPGGLLSKKHRVTDLRILARLKQKRGRVLWDMATAVFMFTILSVPVAFCGEATTGLASFYGRECCRYNLNPSFCPTSSGRSLYELERTKQDFAAAWNYPMGAIVKVTNLGNGKSVTVAIFDRGPSRRLHRVIDLSKRAFSKISSLDKGVIRVSVERVE